MRLLLELCTRVKFRPCSTGTLSRAQLRHPMSTYACQLTHRSLVRVEGEEGRKFLQGMVTANMEQERETGSAFYSMMLNSQGRVLYDLIFFPLLEGKYLMECDSTASADVVKHFRKYALRAKVTFNIDADLSVWALFPGQPPTLNTHDHICTPDPRSRIFGSRAILPSDMKATDVWPDLELTDIEEYHAHRLQSGIPEGINEIDVGNSLPLEFNLEYMNGVSFNKGCYLGQELTARTHHTGVIRKRVMPITLHESPSSPISPGTSVGGGGARSAGKLLVHHRTHGLALLRLQEISKGPLTIKEDNGNEITLSALTPEFWPDTDTTS